jgi:16S rRNA (guanine966-N2)-methyltransferase
MRVIAGTLGGRNFDSPGGHRTHPMSEKMRGAMFAILGDIEGLSVLDAFAGTGALSFEAVSRGARSALLLEVDKQAQDCIERNIHSLNLTGSCRLVRANISSWSDTNKASRFDLVLCDPPYDELKTTLIEKLAGHLNPTGTLVLSWPGGSELPTLKDVSLMHQKSYGDSQLAFYQKLS